MLMFMRRVNLLSRCQSMYRHDKLRHTGLGTVNLSMVLYLCRNPGVSQEELAREICLNKSNVTRNLNQMEELGFVVRRQSEVDRRVTLVYPTEKLLEVLPEVRRVTVDWNAYLTEGFSEEDLAKFSDMLDLMTDRAQKYAKERGESL